MDTPIVIIIICYIASFTVLGVQSVIGDPMNIEMQVFNPDSGSFDGESMRSAINTMSDTFSGCYDSTNQLIGGFSNQTYATQIECQYASNDTANTNTPYTWIEGTNSTYSNLSFQTAQMQITMADEPSVTNNPITAAATLVFQVFQIITGTYAFNLLIFLGIPDIFVVGVSMIYVILLSIWTIMLLRGNSINA